ncbi:MAG: sugar transferase [Candidatus Marinimicrobia bacterium]|nr:sugar transferase [Candidatus Neomarinimicrobiota bacterium]
MSLKFDLQIFFILLLSSLAVKTFSKDYRETNLSFLNGWFAVLKIDIYVFFLAGFCLILIQLYAVTIKILSGTLLTVVIIDTMIYLLRYFFKNHEKFHRAEFLIEDKFNYITFFLNIAFFGFLGVNNHHFMTFHRNFELQKTLILMIFTILAAATVTRNFHQPKEYPVTYKLSHLWKTMVIAWLFFLAFRSIGFQTYFTPMTMLNYYLKWMAFNLVLIMVSGLFQKHAGPASPKLQIDEVVNEYDVSLDDQEFENDDLSNFLRRYQQPDSVKAVGEFFRALEKVTPPSQMIIIKTRELADIKKLQKHRYLVLANRHHPTGFSDINQYFLEIYRRLIPGGFFICEAITIDRSRHSEPGKNEKKPENPGTRFKLFKNKFYFTFLSSTPKDEISKAELLGRLVYCGFQPVSTHMVRGKFLVIGKKSKIPATKELPSEKLISKLKKVGWYGRLFNLLEFRTMAPFSEYLENYIRQSAMADDFRLTALGKKIKKWGLARLPEIINYLRGDLSLIGPAPLSVIEYNSRPVFLREIRLHCRSGLIPQYFADKARTHREILESEQTYFENKKRNPIQTDIKYFFKALKNILLNYTK